MDNVDANIPEIELAKNPGHKPVLFCSQTEKFLNREKPRFWSERSQPEKILTTKHPFLFRNAKRFVAPIEGKSESRQNQPTLSSWFKVVDANSRNLNLESKPQERPKRPETSRVFEKLFKTSSGRP